MGFSDNDLDTLREYLSRNALQETIVLAQQAHVKQKLQQFSKSSVSNNLNQDNEPTLAIAEVANLLEAYRLIENEQWNKWGINLLNKFSKQKQRILLARLQQKLGKAYIAALPMSKDYLSFYRKELLSGETERSFERQLNNIRARATKGEQL